VSAELRSVPGQSNAGIQNEVQGGQVPNAFGGASHTLCTLEDRLRQPFWPAERKWRALLTVAVFLAVALRSIRLMNLFPVLIDEAIYMRWAEIIQHQHTWFVSLLDAKPPLSYWIYAGLRLPFSHQPLLGDRLVSVAAGTLCVIVLYRIGFLCAGPLAGAITALLYSALPFGVFYDRIAYVDSIVNLSGACLVYAILSSFGGAALVWRRTLKTGLILGAALFIKTTILLFALCPLAIGIYLHRRSLRRLVPHMAAVYAVAAFFPLWSQLAVPPAPTFFVNNTLLHHTNFFTPPAILLHHPFLDLSVNAPLLAGYAVSYFGYPALVAIPAAIIALLLFRRSLPLVILVTCVLPFSFATATLEYFPSRYAFAHAWPLLLAIGCAAAIPLVRSGMRAAVYVTAAIVFAGMIVQSARILRTPELALDKTDADEFLTSNPYSGSGVLDAIALLRTEALNGPLTILTDPWWGPPTDTVFAYLNQVDGTRVYEAWWLQLHGEYPLVPAGDMPVWKSQYERVPASVVDFSSLSRLYYITDTNYATPDDVHTMSPAARLIKRFPKRGGSDFVDVYRLN
jgi:hypothetical protein